MPHLGWGSPFKRGFEGLGESLVMWLYCMLPGSWGIARESARAAAEPQGLCMTGPGLLPITWDTGKIHSGFIPMQMRKEFGHISSVTLFETFKKYTLNSQISVI